MSDKIISNLWAKLLNEEIWLTISEGFLRIIAIFIVTGLLIRLGKVAIHNIFKVRSLSPLRTSDRREATMVKLLENILSYVVYFIAFMMLLSTLTIDVKALLAGAGIVGLAVGFGAQNLVRDIITGFFIIFEDQFSVGDYVRIGQFEGNVEEIGLRTTKIKNFSGELYIIPNGNIAEVTNFSLHNSMAIVDVSIAYEGDIERTERVILELLEDLPRRYEDFIKMPELLGVQSLGPSEVILRIVAETHPMRHWYVSRVIRKEVKMWLDEHGIEIPFPRLVMYSRSEEPSEQKAFSRSKGI